MVEHTATPDGLAPGNGLSHVVTGSGRLVAVSGQLPLDENGRIVDASDAAAQARRVFTNVARALAAAEAGPDDVLRLTFYLTDLADLDAVRTARDEFIGEGPPPASSLVQVVRLVHPDARIEVDALAVTHG